MFMETSNDGWSHDPPGELRATFKKNRFFRRDPPQRSGNRCSDRYVNVVFFHVLKAARSIGTPFYRHDSDILTWLSETMVMANGKALTPVLTSVRLLDQQSALRTEP